jgi:hypothetical protein
MQNILDKYAIELLPRAYRDLDGIYEYIAETLVEPGIAALCGLCAAFVRR